MNQRRGDNGDLAARAAGRLRTGGVPALRWVLWVLVGALTGVPWPAHGQGWPVQVHGMFGDRVLGEAVSPRPGAHRGGIVTGPAGQFLGRGRSEGLRFPNMPWQYPVAAEPLGGGRYGPSEPAVVERRPPPGPPPPPGSVPAEEAAPLPPEQWFRAPVDGGEVRAHYPTPHREYSPNPRPPSDGRRSHRSLIPRRTRPTRRPWSPT